MWGDCSDSCKRGELGKASEKMQGDCSDSCEGGELRKAIKKTWGDWGERGPLSRFFPSFFLPFSLHVSPLFKRLEQATSFKETPAM